MRTDERNLFFLHAMITSPDSWSEEPRQKVGEASLELSKNVFILPVEGKKVFHSKALSRK